MPSRTKEQLENIWIKKLMSHIGKGKDKLSQNSLKLYAQRIRRVWKIMYPDKAFKGKTFLHREVKKIIKAINDDDMAMSSKAGIYSAIVSTYHENAKGIQGNGREMYSKQLKIWAEKVKKIEKKQVVNKKQDDRWISKEETEEARKNLLEKAEKSKKLLDYRDYVMFSLFTLLPPRRAADYGEMKISKNEDKEGNVLVPRIKNGKKRFWKFVFNDFKLSEKKGSESFDRDFMENLPNGREILELLDGWLLMNPKGYFLVTPRSNTHMSKAMSRLSKRVLKKPININIFRHMYISNFLDTNPFLLEKEMISTYMSHSVAQQELYRKKIDEEDLKGFEREAPNKVST